MNGRFMFCLHLIVVEVCFGFSAVVDFTNQFYNIGDIV